MGDLAKLKVNNVNSAMDIILDLYNIGAPIALSVISTEVKPANIDEYLIEYANLALTREFVDEVFIPEISYLLNQLRIDHSFINANLLGFQFKKNYDNVCKQHFIHNYTNLYLDIDMDTVMDENILEDLVSNSENCDDIINGSTSKGFLKIYPLSIEATEGMHSAMKRMLRQ